MASIRITKFAGLLPTANPKALENDHAQLAHNCLLWDGWLWPMPQWITSESGVAYGGSLYSPPKCLYKDITQPFGFNWTWYFSNAVQTRVEPFNSGGIAGIYNQVAVGGQLRQIFGPTPIGLNTGFLGVPAPKLNGFTINITPQHQSVYPISRTYAFTCVNGIGQEGPPTVLPQIGTNGSLFEGDIVTLWAYLDGQQILDYNIKSVKLYRTIPGFDTSEELGNPVETGFHFVRSFGVGYPGGGQSYFINIADNRESAGIAGDLLISDQWLPPVDDPFNTQTQPIYFGLTEGGWFVNIRSDSSGGGALQFSERFMNHAWPMQNTVIIPENIVGAAIYYDNVFIGTKSVPYHANIELGESETLNINVRPYKNEYVCLPNSIVSTNFGAMYASKDGLIALTADSDTVATKHLANPGDEILYVTVPRTLGKAHFYDTVRGSWWNGNYFGFISNAGYGYAYIYNQPSPSNNEFPLGQLVTITTPGPNIIDTIVTGWGFFGVWSDGIIRKFPLPGFGYEQAPKQTYTWKSKRFVMSGLTTFAGMKVINDNGGDLYVALIGYNTSTSGSSGTPDFLFGRYLNHSKPFRIPHNHKCKEWEIEVIGTAVIQEIHVSTSYQDLVEDSNVGVSASA